MKNNPILQIVKMLLGAVASCKAVTMLFASKNEYAAFAWFICFIVAAVVTTHGYLKFRGEE